jgi:hypothetical protein
MRSWCCSNFLFLVVALKYFDPGKQEKEQKARLLNGNNLEALFPVLHHFISSSLAMDKKTQCHYLQKTKL